MVWIVYQAKAALIMISAQQSYRYPIDKQPGKKICQLGSSTSLLLRSGIPGGCFFFQVLHFISFPCFFSEHEQTCVVLAMLLKLKQRDCFFIFGSVLEQYMNEKTQCFLFPVFRSIRFQSNMRERGFQTYERLQGLLKYTPKFVEHRVDFRVHVLFFAVFFFFFCPQQTGRQGDAMRWRMDENWLKRVTKTFFWFRFRTHSFFGFAFGRSGTQNKTRVQHHLSSCIQRSSEWCDKAGTYAPTERKNDLEYWFEWVHMPYRHAMLFGDVANPPSSHSCPAGCVPMCEGARCPLLIACERIGRHWETTQAREKPIIKKLRKENESWSRKRIGREAMYVDCREKGEHTKPPVGGNRVCAQHSYLLLYETFLCGVYNMIWCATRITQDGGSLALPFGTVVPRSFLGTITFIVLSSSRNRGTLTPRNSNTYLCTVFSK